MHYKGLFAFGIDHTVVNVTKDRIWMREAALPETTNTARPSLEWLLQNNFGGKIPTEMTFKNPVMANQEQSVRDLEIDPALFTPKDQMRQWARIHLMPAESKINPAELMGAPPAKK
jgi:ribonuclease Z